MVSSCYDFGKSALAPVLKNLQNFWAFLLTFSPTTLLAGRILKRITLNDKNVVNNKANNKLSFHI